MSTAAPATLRQRVFRAGSWSIAGYAASQVLRLGSSLIMTRLLVPEMFGVMAIASTVMAILNMMSDLGLHHNIVQSKRGEDPDFLDTAWTLQVLRGFALWFLAIAVGSSLHFLNRIGAVSAGSVYASPDLPLVIAVSGFSAVIWSVQSTSIALANRNFDQKRLVQIELVSQLAALATVIAIGAATRSIWALVFGGFAAGAITSLLSVTLLKGRRNRFRWEPNALRELIGFGKWTFVSSVFTVLGLNGDKLLLGGFVPPDFLGLYAIATLVLLALEAGLSRLFSAIALPALSEVARNNPGRLREVYYRLRVPGDLVLLSAAGFLFIVGHRFIEILYDPRYHEAGRMLQVLALTFLSTRYNVAYHVYLAIGKPRYLAVINMSRCVALFTLVPAAHALWGTWGAIWAIALNGLAMAPFVHGFNALLGLNRTRTELAVLLALPGGMGLGYLAELAYRWVLA